MFTTAAFLQIVAALLALPGIFFILRAIGRAKKSRSATYYATRRLAANSSNSDLAKLGIIVVIAFSMVVISIFLPPEIVTPVPVSDVPVSTAVSVSTPVPAATVMTTPIARPTPTSTPSGFATASRVPPTSIPVPATISIHQLTLRSISSAITPAGQPISPTTEYSRGVASIYIVYDYVGIQQNTVIHQAWLRNGEGVYYDSSTWSRTGTGIGYFVWSPKKGFVPGLYEVRISLGDIKQFSANFIVK